MDTRDNASNDEIKKTNAAGVNNKADDSDTPAPKRVRRQATQEQLDHPLHGVKLAQVLERLVDHYGWNYLARRVNIRCFMYNPNMKSSLGFLRKMKWAREHVEDIYLEMVEDENLKKN